MTPQTKRGAALAAAAAGTLLLATAPAQAGTIRYDVPPGGGYTVGHPGNGIVKVAYGGCPTPFSFSQRASFDVSVRATGGPATAAFELQNAKGLETWASFSPSSLALEKNETVTARVTVGFTPPPAGDGATRFRIKLDPANGSGLGKGPGLSVRLACTVADLIEDPGTT